MPLTIGERLVVATHNPGKLAEFSAAFAAIGVRVDGGGDLHLPEPDEIGTTFHENAALKARAGAEATGAVTLADDSGLAVAALDGAPGIYSARWAGPGKDFSVAFDRIAGELATRGWDMVGADAAFVCVLALATPEGEVHFTEGRVEGRLTFPPRGEGGFGYDPIFIPQGESRTFAQMTRHEKAAMSHRQRALDALLADLAARA